MSTSSKDHPPSHSQIVALQAELKEAVALLEANAEKIALLSAEREEALAQLNAERKHFDASSSISTEPLDRDNPGVNILEDNVRNKATTINNCSFSVEIH
eukprot:CAMPEP_0182516388 /NCGR_PEP_ID=MMETSP1321-20130603/40202_1 /TAXON_ID=91990 /ORGANISM="Bolidomonas sp., Strain RCC1657" /LENGTH=99 /DNA_ID=CAMNT_0024723955 /DNA_START=169 /DNA_END=465 /DNA_ORIENTATION=-